MTSPSDRACVRGCVVTGVHYATCDSFGDVATGDCKGCAPMVARDGALICERCFRSLRRLLDDAPDLVAHLRSIADPTKARAYDRRSVGASKLELPAPVDAAVIDASNDITITLRAWADRVTDPHGDVRPGHLAAGIDASSAFDDARGCADIVIEDLERIANDKVQILALCEAVLNRSRQSAPSFWSIADVSMRWSLEDAPRWADVPCPECDIKTVRVLPARRGGRTKYVCRTCDWEADDQDDGGLWAQVFAGGAEPVVISRLPHDPRWLTLAAAARLAKRSASTIRNWVERGYLEPQLGRYWQADVEAAVKRVTGEAA